MQRKVARKALTRSAEASKREGKYIKGVLAIYGKDERTLRSAKGLTGPDLAGFHLKLFMYKAEYNLGSKLDKSLSAKLRDIRLSDRMVSHEDRGLVYQ